MFQHFKKYIFKKMLVSLTFFVNILQNIATFFRNVGIFLHLPPPKVGTQQQGRRTKVWALSRVWRRRVGGGSGGEREGG
jgi:hypothetical protein